MSFLNIFFLSVLSAVFAAQLFRPGILRFLGRVFVFAAILVLAISFYWSFLQYSAWKEGELTQFLLPPHQSIDYFLTYVGKRIFAPYFIALLAAIFVPRIAERLNRKYEERFFEREEFPLMRIGILASGYPGFLFYIASVLAAGVLLSWLYALLGKGRAPLYWFWMPAAALTVVAVWKFIPPLMLARFAL